MAQTPELLIYHFCLDVHMLSAKLPNKYYCRLGSGFLGMTDCLVRCTHNSILLFIHFTHSVEKLRRRLYSCWGGGESFTHKKREKKCSQILVRENLILRMASCLLEYTIVIMRR